MKTARPSIGIRAEAEHVLSGAADAHFDFTDVEGFAVAPGELHQDLVRSLLVVHLRFGRIVAEECLRHGWRSNDGGLENAEQIKLRLAFRAVGVHGLFAELHVA